MCLWSPSAMHAWKLFWRVRYCFLVLLAPTYSSQLVCSRYPYWEMWTSWTSTFDINMWHWTCSSKVCLNSVEWSLACCLPNHVFCNMTASVLWCEGALLPCAGKYGRDIASDWVHHFCSGTCKDHSLHTVVFWDTLDLTGTLVFFIILPFICNFLSPRKACSCARGGGDGNTDFLNYQLA